MRSGDNSLTSFSKGSPKRLSLNFLGCLNQLNPGPGAIFPVYRSSKKSLLYFLSFQCLSFFNFKFFVTRQRNFNFLIGSLGLTEQKIFRQKNFPPIGSIRTKQQVAYTSHQGAVFGARFSPTMDVVVSVGDDKTIQFT